MVNLKLQEVLSKIENAAVKCGREPDDIRLICVTKTANSSDILAAVSFGMKDLGENRVQDAHLKYRAIGDNAVWHLIGHLQTNKVKDAVRIFKFIHSVDSLKLAAAIDKAAKNAGKVQSVLIEVNVSGEKTKFGVNPESLGDLIGTIKGLVNLDVIGLMTVPPLTDMPEKSRKYFAELRRLRDQYGLKELSMGMTQDYEIAIQEGATMIRVGRAIFS